MESAEPKSKSQIKREHREVQEFVRTLVSIAENQLKKLPLSESIMEEIRSAKSMQKTALKRQIGYIAKKMAEEPVQEVMTLLAGLQKPDAQVNAQFHQLETWRDTLLQDNQETVHFLVENYHADRQHLRQLIRNARRERIQDATPRSARLLFQYLRRLTAT